MGQLELRRLPAGVEYLGESIDPSELRRAIDALEALRSKLKSEILRDDVGVALSRIARIRLVEVSDPTSSASSEAA